MKLTAEQTLTCIQMMESTKELRQRITLYKKGDPGFAFFRTQATHHIQEAYLAKLKGHKLPVNTRKWLIAWNHDLGIGRDITELFKQIEEYEEK